MSRALDPEQTDEWKPIAEAIATAGDCKDRLQAIIFVE
jgi:hypothetical protein